MKTLDLTGNPCPIPVIKTKKEMEKAAVSGVRVLVDNIVAVENLKKMADGMGYTFSYVNQDENFMITIGKGTADVSAEAVSEQGESGAAQEEGVTVLVTADQMGRGSEELGRIMIKGFLFSLTELAVAPKAVIFLNSGIKLTTEGSNVIEDLQVLLDKGSNIVSCGTCLNYYSLTEKLMVGKISNMFEITEHLTNAASLITL